jgi:hypothetical protein
MNGQILSNYHYKKYDVLWYFYLWQYKICHKITMFMTNFMMTFWSMTKKCLSLNFSQKCHKLTYYKIMTFFVTITYNVIIVAELDLLTRLSYWHGCHMLLLDPNVKFDIKLKIIVKQSKTWIKPTSPQSKALVLTNRVIRMLCWHGEIKLYIILRRSR